MGVLGYAPHYGDVSEEHAIRLGALYDLLSGVDPWEVEQAMEHEGTVGFLPALMPAAMSLAAPMISKILPGGKKGGAAAPAAPAAPMAQTPGATLAIPGGPIIVRF
jgi:hypothetical protein